MTAGEKTYRQTLDHLALPYDDPPELRSQATVQLAQLVDRLIELAIDRHQRKQQTRFTR